MKTRWLQIATTVLAVSFVSSAAVADDYPQYMGTTAGGNSTDEDYMTGVPSCPTYPLHRDYYGWINLAGDEWSFDPNDPTEPVEVIAYDPRGDGGDPESPDLLGLALLRIDMRHYTEVRVTVYYNRWPEGWLTNLGNSRTNNACGGDSGTNSFDGEAWSVLPPAVPDPCGGCELGATTNDFDYRQYPWGAADRAAGLCLRGVFIPGEYTTVEYVVRDKSLSVWSSAGPMEVQFAGECVSRIDTTLWDPELEDCNDAQLWLGLNRVVRDTARLGNGAEYAEIMLIGSGPPPDEQEEME
jgi:hypothetical protein